MITSKIKIVALVLYVFTAMTAIETKAFDTPVWDTTARWSSTLGEECGSGAPMELNGPRLEVGSGRAMLPAFIMGGHGGHGPFGLLSYNKMLDRIHFVCGSGARGNLDGPFGVARFNSNNYVERGVHVNSPSGKHAYIIEPQNKRVLRFVDFIKQEVRSITIPSNIVKVNGITVDSSNHLYVIGNSLSDSNLMILSQDGTMEFKKLEMTGLSSGLNMFKLTLDEKRGFLYVSEMNDPNFYVSYWDLADGSYHGLLPIGGEPLRAKNEPGPFAGTLLYNEMNISFGADDPDKRFLYVYPNDTRCIFRMDLQTKIIWVLTTDKNAGVLHFISSGTPDQSAFSGWTMKWNDYGDLTTNITAWNFVRTMAFRRIK